MYFSRKIKKRLCIFLFTCFNFQEKYIFLLLVSTFKKKTLLFLFSVLCSSQLFGGVAGNWFSLLLFFSSLLCTFSSFVLFTPLKIDFFFPNLFLALVKVFGLGWSNPTRTPHSHPHPHPHQCRVETCLPAKWRVRAN